MSVKPKKDGVHLNQIRRILGEVCNDSIKAEQAYFNIEDAIHEYQKSYPYAVDSYLSREKISDIRKEVSALLKQIEKVSSCIEGLSLEAKIQVSNVMDMNFVEVKALLLPLKDGVETAKNIVERKPDKSPDFYRNILAREIAKALSDVGIPVASTRLGENINGSRNGATYARVLDHACKQAGLPSIKLDDLIDEGIKLWKDSALP